MRSKSFTSCFFDDMKPAGSVQARTTVTGIGDPLMHWMVNAEETDNVEKFSDV